MLQNVLGDRIKLVDSAQAITYRAGELLKKTNLLNTYEKPPEYQFYITDVPIRFQVIGERFLGRALSNVTVIKW